MENFPRHWPFVQGIHRSSVNFPHKGQWRGALMFSLICTRRNGWVNNGDAGDLRRHRAHHDVIVMKMSPAIVSRPQCCNWVAMTQPWRIHYMWFQLERLRSMIPPPPHDYPYQWFTSDPKWKHDKVKVTNFKECQKSNLKILQAILHATRLLKLLDKMYKYEMVPSRNVGATERTRDAGRTDGRSETNLPPNNFVLLGV